MCTVHGHIYTQSVYTHKRNSILYPLCCCCCSVTQLCPSLCDIMNCSTPGFPELHHLPEFAQTHVYWVYDAIQPSHPLSSPSSHALNLSQNQSLFQWIDSSHHVAEILELQLQHQFSSVTQSCPTLWDPMNRSMPGLPVHHQLLESTQTHVHWVGDAIQPSHPLLSPSPPALNLSHHQGLFKWVSPSHQMAKVLEFQLQPQSFQWIFRVDFL